MRAHNVLSFFVRLLVCPAMPSGRYAPQRTLITINKRIALGPNSENIDTVECGTTYSSTVTIATSKDTAQSTLANAHVANRTRAQQCLDGLGDASVTCDNSKSRVRRCVAIFSSPYLTMTESIQVHFSHFYLPKGAVVRVGKVDDAGYFSDLKGEPRDPVSRGSGDKDGRFSAMRVHAPVVKVTLWWDDTVDAWREGIHKVEIDRFVVENLDKHKEARRRVQFSHTKKTACETHSFQNIRCALHTHDEAMFYRYHKAVGYLYIHKFLTQAEAAAAKKDKAGNVVEDCTGWRVGPENRVMTNYHCLQYLAGPLSTIEMAFFWQNEECSTHDDDRAFNRGVCKVVLDKVLVSDKSKDFSLVTINNDQFEGLNEITGYFALDLAEPVPGRKVALLMHPGGLPKKYIVCHLLAEKLNTNGRYANFWGHGCDELGGSSGSPLVDVQTGKVVLMHTVILEEPNCMRGGSPPVMWWPDIQRFFTNEQPPEALVAPLADHYGPDAILISAYVIGAFSIIGIILITIFIVKKMPEDVKRSFWRLTKASPSKIDKHALPGEGGSTPRERTVSAKEGENTPTAASSPRQGPSSSRQGTNSPRRANSQKEGANSPREMASTQKEGETSPRKGVISSATGTPSDQTSPQGNVSPLGGLKPSPSFFFDSNPSPRSGSPVQPPPPGSRPKVPLVRARTADRMHLRHEEGKTQLGPEAQKKPALRQNSSQSNKGRSKHLRQTPIGA